MCKCKLFFWAAVGLASSGLTTNVYVVPPETAGVSPDGLYQTWATAATNIADAIAAINTNGGNIVFISNGTYILPDQIVVDKGVALRSWKDGDTARESTILDANNFPGKPVTNRVIYLNHNAAVLDGLMVRGGCITNGHGSGIYIANAAMITNCAVIGNTNTTGNGGGIYIVAGAKFGVITHCCIASNYAAQGGGMFMNSGQGRVEYCQILTNYAFNADAANGGGGIRGGNWGAENVAVRNCLIAWNACYSEGPGVNLWYSGVVENCRIVSNHNFRTSSTRHSAAVFLYTGGVVADAGAPVLRNCLVAENTSLGIAHAAVVANISAAIPCNETAVRIENCTIASHPDRQGFKRNDAGSATSLVQVVNTVIYGNGTDMFPAYISNTVFSNCLSTIALPGSGNLTNQAPVFADTAFRLDRDSPGVNAGLNLPWMSVPGAVELDGRNRVDRMFRRVDMGCYEYVFQGTVFGVR